MCSQFSSRDKKAIAVGSSVKRDTLIWVLPSENDCKAYSVGQKLKPFQGRLSRLKLVPIAVIKNLKSDRRLVEDIEKRSQISSRPRNAITV